MDKGENFGAQADFIAYPTQAHTPAAPANSFTDTAKQSLNRVNELQQAKDQAIVDFASGRNQNVHELMITMQKSSLAMKLTTAVRARCWKRTKNFPKCSSDAIFHASSHTVRRPRHPPVGVAFFACGCELIQQRGEGRPVGIFQKAWRVGA